MIKNIYEWAYIGTLCVVGLFFVFSMKEESSVVRRQVELMNERLDRIEERQVSSDEKQDRELQNYWDTLEMRLSDMQKMQFENIKNSCNRS